MKMIVKLVPFCILMCQCPGNSDGKCSTQVLPLVNGKPFFRGNCSSWLQFKWCPDDALLYRSSLN
ncbi:hypothetical protein HOLleu_09680 [Holothuria leucospilota]|uniref:Uncharacterized protein n=1 Tax=Holothuria leucospilota TaxID=206669 RepID=A0A9Q1CD90_HOLLE|nr:hypothetical protein HOLleu_09680 [Holothuria leucospilota]